MVLHPGAPQRAPAGRRPARLGRGDHPGGGAPRGRRVRPQGAGLSRGSPGALPRAGAGPPGAVDRGPPGTLHQHRPRPGPDPLRGAGVRRRRQDPRPSRTASCWTTAPTTPWASPTPTTLRRTCRGRTAIPSLAVTGTCVATNKVPNAPYRGAGRPEAVFVMERCIDRIAGELGLDPAEVRFRNFVQPEEIPYDAGVLYRDGHARALRQRRLPRHSHTRRWTPVATTRSERDRRRPRANETPPSATEAAHDTEATRDGGTHDGRYLGVGIGFYTEGTGVGSFEGARVEVDSSGKLLRVGGSQRPRPGTRDRVLAAHRRPLGSHA